MRHNIYFKIIISLLISIFICSCQKNETFNIPPTCNLLSPVKDTTIAKGRAINISINASDADGNIKAVDFFIDNNKIDEVNSLPYTYSYKTSNLSIGNHLLKVEAYDNNNAKAIALAKIKIIVDSTLFPSVKTIAATNITSNSAICGGNVLTDGGSGIVSRYILYGYIPAGDSTYKLSYAYATSNSTGVFSCQLTNLIPNTEYHYGACAKNSVDSIGNGEELIFKTAPSTALTVSTDTASKIDKTSATCGGNVISYGYDVTAKGICWSTKQNPTIADNHIPSGTGSGHFTCNLSNLSALTTYYLRAYAINCAGVTYGNQISFTTLNPITTTNITFVNPTFTKIYITFNNSSNTQTIASGSQIIYKDVTGTSAHVSAYTYETLSSGEQLGEKLNWDNDITLSGGNYTYNLNAPSNYFYLCISNSGSGELSPVYVNYGLSSQYKADVDLPNDGVKYSLGYYKAYTNSNVRAYYYSNPSNYISWDQGVGFTLPFTVNQSISLTNSIKKKSINDNSQIQSSKSLKGLRLRKAVNKIVTIKYTGINLYCK